MTKYVAAKRHIAPVLAGTSMIMVVCGSRAAKGGEEEQVWRRALSAPGALDRRRQKGRRMMRAAIHSGSFLAMTLVTLMTGAPSCDISALQPSHQGTCMRSSCSLFGLTIDGFVAIERAALDPVVQVTLCRDGTCLSPVDVGTAFPTGKTVAGVFYNVSFQAAGAACYGVGPVRMSDGICILLNPDDATFPLTDGHAYDLTVTGAMGKPLVTLKNQVANYTENSPQGCERPELVVCRHAEIIF